MVASQPGSYSDRRGKTVYPVFNCLIFLLLDGQNPTLLNSSFCNHRLLTPPIHHACNGKNRYQSALIFFEESAIRSLIAQSEFRDKIPIFRL